MSVRVTRRVRRVLESLARSDRTVAGLIADTGISPSWLWPVIDRLETNGWIAEAEDAYQITELGRRELKALPLAHVPKVHG